MLLLSFLNLSFVSFDRGRNLLVGHFRCACARRGEGGRGIFVAVEVLVLF